MVRYQLADTRAAWDYVMLYDPENPEAQTSDLGIVHFKEGLISQKYTYQIPSDIEQSNQTETWKNNLKMHFYCNFFLYLGII